MDYHITAAQFVKHGYVLDLEWGIVSIMRRVPGSGQFNCKINSGDNILALFSEPAESEVTFAELFPDYDPDFGESSGFDKDLLIDVPEDFKFVVVETPEYFCPYMPAAVVMCKHDIIVPRFLGKTTMKKQIRIDCTDLWKKRLMPEFNNLAKSLKFRVYLFTFGLCYLLNERLQIIEP